MSLTVQQLNGDTTFLLTFYPRIAPQAIANRSPADFIILVDPWLQGHASMIHPSFLLSRHTSTPALHSLKDLAQAPDVVIITQDKPDHCHKETLCSLPKSQDTSILAIAAAAKKIRSWKHFDDQQIHVLDVYDPVDTDSIYRVPVPGQSSSGADGEIAIANIPTKRDLIGVHNAIGITYRPSVTKLIDSNTPGKPSSPTKFSSEPAASRAPTLSTSTPGNNTDTSQVASRQKEDVLSIIYTPHGVSPDILEPYIDSHLNGLGALPLSALIHGFGVERNPWFMGGTVANGAPGGVQLCQRWPIEHWIAAHDEKKVNKGLATMMIKSTSYDVEQVEALLGEAGVKGTKVHQLPVGETLCIPEGGGGDSAIRNRRLVERCIPTNEGHYEVSVLDVNGLKRSPILLEPFVTDAT